MFLEDRTLMEGVILKDGVPIELKNIDNQTRKIWEVYVGQCKLEFHEKLLVENVYQILNKAVTPYFDYTYQTERITIHEGDIGSTVLALLPKLNPFDLLHLIVSTACLPENLFLNITKKENFFLVTDLSQNASTEEMKLSHPEGYILKKRSEGKYVLFSPISNTEVTLHQCNSKYWSVRMTSGDGEFEVIMEGERTVSSMLEKRPKCKKK